MTLACGFRVSSRGVKIDAAALNRYRVVWAEATQDALQKLASWPACAPRSKPVFSISAWTGARDVPPQVHQTRDAHASSFWVLPLSHNQKNKEVRGTDTLCHGDSRPESSDAVGDCYSGVLRQQHATTEYSRLDAACSRRLKCVTTSPRRSQYVKSSICGYYLSYREAKVG